MVGAKANKMFMEVERQQGGCDLRLDKNVTCYVVAKQLKKMSLRTTDPRNNILHLSSCCIIAYAWKQFLCHLSLLHLTPHQL